VILIFVEEINQKTPLKNYSVDHAVKITFTLCLPLIFSLESSQKKLSLLGTNKT